MSLLLTSSIPPKFVSRQLSCLDVDSESATPDRHLHLQRGPFGVFRGNETKKTQTPDDLAMPCDGSDEALEVQDVLNNIDDIVLYGSTTNRPWSPSFMNNVFDSSVQMLLQNDESPDMGTQYGMNTMGQDF
ncbi:hypothetical protein I5L01_15370, partial [Erythrobacter sp. YJ-T3-07]|uniref:hypothetical protein n=1 Tax=Erythrobacter sp. YJ-T3-07 TaxID=2793063 RepID=UPI0018D2B1E5